MPRPHEVLGISIDASMEEAQLAYRKLSMQYHPDRPNGNAEKFRAVSAAYEALRSKYKATGLFDDIISWAAKENKL